MHRRTVSSPATKPSSTTWEADNNFDYSDHYFNGQQIPIFVLSGDPSCDNSDIVAEFVLLSSVMLNRKPHPRGGNVSDETGRTGRRNFMMATGALGVGAGMAMVAGTTATAETSPDNSLAQIDNTGPATFINQGVTLKWNFSYGAPTDRHVQIAGGNALPPLNGAELWTTEFGKANNNGNVTYFARIRNDGPGTAVHNIEAGGLT
jgi:hypothetical protein